MKAHGSQRLRDLPIARLDRSERMQRGVHPGEVPELHVEVEAASDQTRTRRV